MSEQHWAGYCPQCQQSRRFVREVSEPPHVVPGLLTLLCCGVWSIVWLIDCLSRQPAPWQCPPVRELARFSAGRREPLRRIQRQLRQSSSTIPLYR